MTKLGPINWTAVGVFISALGFAGLAISIWITSQAIRLSAEVADATAAFEVSERLANAGRRFEQFRLVGDRQKMQYELSYMSATVETYLFKTAKIRERSDSDPALVVGGIVKVLASALPCDETAKPLGPLFREKGYPMLGALAEEMGLRTPCS